MNTAKIAVRNDALARIEAGKNPDNMAYLVRGEDGEVYGLSVDVAHVPAGSTESYQPLRNYVDYPIKDWIKPVITYAHEHPWASVSTSDGERTLKVAIGGLCYYQDGSVYLLAHDESREYRLYLDAR